MSILTSWKVLLMGILILAAFLRICQLDKIPTGITDDELAFVLNTKAVFFTGSDLT